MVARSLLAAILIWLAAQPAAGQAPAAAASSSPSTAWRSSDGTGSAGSMDRGAQPAAAGAGAIAAPAATRQPIARVTAGSGSLPNEHGQVWREYDISPYTLRVTSTNRPEQAIVDWILRETGYEAWHSEPLGILSATQRTLRVYHTPEIQAAVADIVDRFVASQAETHAFGIHVITLASPNWRARAHRILRPVQTQTQGVQAWLLSKEETAMLIADLRRRNDYREHSSPHLLVNNGQSTVVSATRGRSYVRSVKPRPEAWPGFEPETSLVDEGFSLELSPLLAVDGQSIDALVKCHIDQVEKLVPVIVDMPSPVAPRQQAKLEVPQMVHVRFQERFRWPVEQVLLVGMGVCPHPVPADATPTVAGVPLPIPLPTSPARADMLVFVESKGKPASSARASRSGLPEAKTYQGRY